MAPSFCFVFLTALCTAQFILISKIIFTGQYNIPQPQSPVFVKSPDIQRLEVKRELQPVVETMKCPPYLEPKASPIEGVAVTVMLHSPTWFQRRYTMLIQNTVNNIPKNWKIQIFYTGKGQSQAGLDINPGINRHIESGIVVLTKLPNEMSKIKKYQLMFQPWFWENMLADRVLLFGGSSVICSNSMYSIKDFIQYDYIGSPWGAKKGVGGDGGISIRNRVHILKALNYARGKIKNEREREKAYEEWGQEDHFYVETLLEMKKQNLIDSNIAPKDVTYKFSAIGSYANETVLVASGTLPDVPFAVRDKFLQYCPELKMVYPSLHDPNCFGASPNSEGCAKSICALRPKTERKGGC